MGLCQIRGWGLGDVVWSATSNKRAPRAATARYSSNSSSDRACSGYETRVLLQKWPSSSPKVAGHDPNRGGGCGEIFREQDRNRANLAHIRKSGTESAQVRVGVQLSTDTH